MKRSSILFGLIAMIVGSHSLKAHPPEPFPSEGDTVKPFTTFKSTRLLNSHSTETLLPGDLEFRITHRFGDIAGENGGYHTLFGIDEARDIRFALEYGMFENFTIGIGRSKGAGPLQELYDGFLKYRLIKQNESFPFTITALASMTGTIMRSSDNPSSPTNFGKFAHRFGYFHQLLIASRISDRLSLQFMPSYSHRNLVSNRDRNTVIGLGLGGTLKLTKKWGIIGEYHFTLPRERYIAGAKAFDPLAVGVELETGGHIFHITVSNSGGIGGGQYLPHTRSDITEGEVRFGFTISRLFNL